MLERCSVIDRPQLRVLRCSSCGRLECSPREICPGCLSTALHAVEVDGAGTLVSWTIIRRPPTRFREHEPYCVAVVDLDVGIRLMARLEGDVEAARPGASLVLVEQHGEVAIFRPNPAASLTGDP